ncbi:MAG TPA: acetylxylan esterase [Pirellulales bacterium]
MSARVVSLLLGSLLMMTGISKAAPPAKAAVKPANTDEALVKAYTLPDPLKFADGSAVATAADWTQRRRPQLLAAFTEQMFGQAPPAPGHVDYKVVSQLDDALGGKAVRKEIEITLAGGPQPVVMTMLLYVPKSARPAPVFWGLNFFGNHSVTQEKDVRLNPGWMVPFAPETVNHRATEAARGTQAQHWPVEMIVDRGYALATAYYGDIDPDFDDGFENGIHAAFYRPGQTAPAANEWGSIAAWAWGLSRGLDYLRQDAQINARRVAVIGHSRLGKAALWAGARDPRFALVISNDSGCGGAALSRRDFGETVANINQAFPHWFCGNFKQYGDHEASLPFDQHELLALIAPRPLYVASATLDLWADPKGEFLSAVHADPVYRLLSTDGFGGSAPPSEMPPPDHALKTGTIGYHVRTGKHDVTTYDWQQYLDFADRRMK